VVSPGTGWNLINLAGRLVEAVTDTCASAPITDEWFSYSPRGELTDVYESTPHSGGYYHTQASYWPTGKINSLSALKSNATALFPTVYYGASDGSGLDGEGRFTKVTAASGTNPVTGVTYDTSGSRATWRTHQGYVRFGRQRQLADGGQRVSAPPPTRLQ